MISVQVNLSSNSYIINVGKGLFTQHQETEEAIHMKEELRKIVFGRMCIIITDSKVDELYGTLARKILLQVGAKQVGKIVFPSGEANKTLHTVEYLYRSLIKEKCDRKTVIIALGGGVVGDVAGFCAATFMRGVDYIQVPTTLLAQVDSSIGGKTGVDLPEGKNLVGAFKQPKHVCIDVITLCTLPWREVLNGIAEVVKYGMIMDEEFFLLLESYSDKFSTLDLGWMTKVVAHCCELKAKVVGKDEEDRTGQRAILNYGHTFGHAIELVGRFEKYTHGEAVSIGMMMAAELAVEQGFCSPEVLYRQQNLWEKLGLLTFVEGIEPEEILLAMQKDKKYEEGKTCLILPEKVGSCKPVYGISHREILKAIQKRTK